MILVFDVDDTLYDELTYVESGFLAVSKYLSKNYRIAKDVSLQYMLEKLKLGRGRIFDDLLLTYGIYQKELVRKCLSIYRNHQPDIQLDSDAVMCLERYFHHIPLYVVTDGNKLVQANKIKTLGLSKWIKFCYITHRYGIKNSKPSPYCFLKICGREKVSPGEVVYVADNPRKDFVGIKPLGFKTIRVMKGQHRSVEMTDEYEADFRIDSLDELTADLLAKIFMKGSRAFTS